MSRGGTYKPVDARIVTIPVSPELHRRLRVHLAEEGRTMKWLGIKALEKYLAHHDAMKQLGIIEDQPATPNAIPNHVLGDEK